MNCTAHNLVKIMLPSCFRPNRIFMLDWVSLIRIAFAPQNASELRIQSNSTASLNTLIGQRRSHRWMIYTCINWFDLILPESSKFFKINCRLSQISNVPFYSELELFPPQFELKEALPYWFCIRRTTSDWASANQSKPTLISNCGAKSMLH